MKLITSLFIVLVLPSLQSKIYAQEEKTFYRTNTTYQAYQLDKVPFAMKKMTIVLNDDSIAIADKMFYVNTLKDGSIIYLTADRKSYLLVIDKTKQEQAGFIVCPNGKDWSCYFRYYKTSKNANSIPPDDYSNDEVGLLKETVAKIVDPRIQYYYFTYSSFPDRANTYFAKDSLDLIFISPDTISVGANNFIKKSNDLYLSPGHTYLYMPDNETLVFRDPDISSWASFYQKDINKANKLISQEYKSEKELAAANKLINNTENSKTKSILNSYFGSIRNYKNNPALANSIIKYWNSRWPGSPAYNVIFVDGDLHVTANSLGIPLRRSITAWVVYKKNGKCLAQWHEYGYEYMGGGAYAQELTQWMMNSREYYLTAKTQQGSEYLHSGEVFEFDCSLIK